MLKRVLSGMQPTGRLHLGHYLGVLKNYVKLQSEYDCYFMAANWHSLTAFYTNYKEAHQYISPLISDWLAAGLDPEKSTIFVQSDVPFHTELSLLLSMYTPVSWLERNPTYKEKQENIDKDIDSYGFLGYPVLQAADIFLYKGELVPIGEDQLPHLELSREIARRFNHINKLEGKNAIIEPKPLLSENPKVSGTDGRKMSKSYGNTLSLSEDENDLRDKMKKMKTDTGRVKRTDVGNPDNCPVFTYYNYFLPARKMEIDSQCRSAGIGCIDCKNIISDQIVKETEPFRESRKKNIENPDLIKSILEAGAKKARKTAGETIANLKDSIGMNSDYRILI
ncbi:MAG: tryptophan--tRNA ligase [Spirochaetia bacterium]|nr:tryptophan--tRNA ligase [Spirochaetia bacterium]